MPKATVLSIDDDPNLQFVVQQYLEEEGYKVIQAHSGREVEDRLATNQLFDLVLLDLMLPDAEGFSMIAKIRMKTAVPIIIVSGKSDTTEKIVGLEMGADDYITKPFEMRELSARIKAALRRSDMNDAASNQNNDTQRNTAEKILFNEGWCLDRSQYQLYDKKGEPLELTTGEFKLLEAMVLNANKALSRESLFDLTRADGKFDSYDRAIDIQIARIRKKIGDSGDVIKTVRGVGYMFSGTINK